MKVLGLDGREYTIKLRGREVGGLDTRKRSAPHLKVRVLLKRLYPLAPVLEEVGLPGSDGLTADFFIPYERMMVEIHGPQHFKYVPYFHGNRAGFLQAMRNDRRKSEWCNLNNINLVILSDAETEVEWERRIRGGKTPEDGDGTQ